MYLIKRNGIILPDREEELWKIITIAKNAVRVDESGAYSTVEVINAETNYVEWSNITPTEQPDQNPQHPVQEIKQMLIYLVTCVTGEYGDSYFIHLKTFTQKQAAEKFILQEQERDKLALKLLNDSDQRIENWRRDNPPPSLDASDNNKLYNEWAERENDIYPIDDPQHLIDDRKYYDLGLEYKIEELELIT
jgi:hypothetical protein